MSLTIERRTVAQRDSSLAATYRQVLILQEYLPNDVDKTVVRANKLVTIRKSYGQITELVVEPRPTPSGRALLLLDRAVEKVRSFATLPVDWDSYGAPPVTETAVQQGLVLLRAPELLRLLPAHQVHLAAFPRRDGGLQLDIDGGRLAIEIEVMAEGETVFTFFDADNEVQAEFNSLVEAVTWYTSSDT